MLCLDAELGKLQQAQHRVIPWGKGDGVFSALLPRIPLLGGVRTGL